MCEKAPSNKDKKTNLYSPRTRDLRHKSNHTNVRSQACSRFVVDHRGVTGGDWVDDGCFLNASRDGRVHCTCDHMTHFVSLLQVKEDAPKLVGNSVECLIYSRTVLSSFYLVEFVSFESVKSYCPKHIPGNLACF